jgi:hypothetical protein
LALAGVARAEQCKLRGGPWLESETGQRAVDARVGESVTVFVAAPALVGGKPVVLGGARGRVPWERCENATFAWRRVEPLLEHTKTPAPNADIKVYANAIIFGEHHGKWIGYDKLESIETALPGDGSSLVVRDAQPSAAINAPDRGEQKSLGIMRLAAMVTVAGESRSTPAELERAFRYTYRSGDDFLGWLWTYYNVPYLFGSVTRQVDSYYGADCADVLVAALRRTGVKMAYTNVVGLVDRLPHTAPPAVLEQCQPDKAPCKPTALRWGRDVRPGDLIALDYVGADELPRAWDHIVAAVQDSGPDGKPDGFLGPEDFVADSGDRRALRVGTLGDQGHVRVVVLRAKR